MKLITTLSIVLIFIILSASRCKKDPVNPIDQLPPETQTGANTFGCLVNGQVFKPGGAQLSGGSLQCNYQYLGTGVNGSYYFVLSGRYQNNNNGTGNGVGVFTDSLQIQEGIKYILKTPLRGNSYGRYSSYTTPGPFISYDTDGNLFTDELWIKKLDTINQIVSGTFWFDAVNNNNQKIEIREGRFDVRYTR